MTIPIKLPNPPKYFTDEIMTEKDWEEYYADRKRLDVPVPQDEELNMLMKAAEACQKEDKTEFREISSHIPCDPAWALAIKDCHGFKAVSKRNLIEAKKVFPNDF
ncbi:MAG: hypothetical protein IJ228_04220 [Succinivibrio sp.]|nr:hypothetical protein [Succinivibrio sp.]